MRVQYGAWSFSWDLAVEHSVYFKRFNESRSDDKPRIACYSRHVTPRRCVELMFVALEIASASGVEFEVDFFGWPLGDHQATYKYVDHGIVGEDTLASIYNKATIGMVFSGTNYSLIPKEMMACGLHVIELSTASIRQEFSADLIEMCEPEPNAIASSICTLLTNTSKRTSLATKGLEFVKQSHWEDSVRRTSDAILSRLGELT